MNNTVEEKPVESTSSHTEILEKGKRSCCFKCNRPRLLMIAGIVSSVLVALVIGGTVGWFIKPKPTKMEMEMVSDACVNDLYDMMDLVVAGMKRHELEYWVMYGTLIGVRRNTPAGPLRWDDDLDVAMWESDEEKLKTTLFKDEAFTSKVKVTEVPFGYQFRLVNTRAKCKDDILDVFLHRYEDRSPHGKQWYEKSGWFNHQYIHDKSEVYPLRSCKIWNFDTFCPNQTDVILKRAFSENVLTHAKMWSHTQSVDEIVDLRKHVNGGNTMPQMTHRIAKIMKFCDSQWESC